jgi:glycerophosphoryl diester phosphodiesterase
MTVTPTPIYDPKDIECWGHRGASAFLPENTLASFRAAIKEGASGIESDVHITSDGVVLMFHDPTLDRTTNGTGTIRSQPWHGTIEHVRTTKEPVQPIPLFEQLIALIMEPENQHVTLNIDCKMQNDPNIMFPEMARIIQSHPGWETKLAPRLILGLWHPIFIRPAYEHLPLLRRYHSGISPRLARQYFWEACEGFSIAFAMLIGPEGQQFIRDVREAGKEVCVWTVNDPSEMRAAMAWGVKAVLTDKVGAFVKLRDEVVADPAKLAIPGLAGWIFPWSSWKYYSATHVCAGLLVRTYLRSRGSLSPPDSPPSSTSPLPMPLESETAALVPAHAA